MIPFQVIQPTTSNGKYKLVARNYKGKGVICDKQPCLEEFSEKDQAKLKRYVRQNHPCFFRPCWQDFQPIAQRFTTKIVRQHRSNHGGYVWTTILEAIKCKSITTLIRSIQSLHTEVLLIYTIG